MDPFESNLRNALRDVEAPAGLADRVLSRAAAPPKSRPWFAYPVRNAAAAVLVLALGSGTFLHLRDRAARLESERARERVAEAFRLAAEQLRPFHNRLTEMQQMTIPVPEGKAIPEEKD
jgi:hypothetical protein